MLQTTPKTPIRPSIQTLEPNGIALVSGTALHDPDVIAQKEARRYANWCWVYAPECLAWELSSALH